MHTSTSVSIARYFHAPNAAKGRMEWTPNLPRFEQLLAKPEYIDNLHFAFLVLMRAIAKAGDLLLVYDYSSGDVMEKAIVRELVKRLVETSNIESCAPVFTAFDEMLMSRFYAV